MKPLKLYKIEPVGLPVMHIAARSNEQAAEIYLTWQAAHESIGCAFSVELVELDGLERSERLQIQGFLANSTEGIASHDKRAGWVIDSDGWASFDSDEVERPRMRIFQMRDLTPIEAFVLAADYDRASNLFEQHLRAHGGDPHAVLYRELELQHLHEPANDGVYEALELDCEGLVTCDANGRWAFITPLGNRKVPPDEA